MNITENRYLIDEILKLAHNKSTGTPNQLSDSVGLSVRSLYRIIESIKDQGIPIRYSRSLRSYIVE